VKRLEITDHVRQLMKANLDNVPDESKIAVFETIAATTQPMRKKGTIWENAVMTPAFLGEMASSVKLGYTPPLHIMHEDQLLPVGRVFHAERTSLSETRALFFTDKLDLADDIDNSVIDSVSVGVAPKHINCSACGWDYLGDDADFMNAYDRICPNGHMIGQDGVHVTLNGLDSWLELSAVGTGALQGAKITNRAKSLLANAQETRTRLAASGRTPEPYICIASFEGASEMDLKAFTETVTAQATEIATLKASVAALEPLKAQLTEAQGQVTALNTQVTDLTAKAAQNTAVVAFLKEHAQRAVVAAGGKADSIPADADVAKLMQVIEEAQTNLVNLFKAGGTSVSADAKGAEKGQAPMSAFKTRKSA
jgi:hypothetical protein